MFKSGKPGEKEHDRFKEVMGWVNDFIKPTGYVAGTKHLTLADVAFVSTYGYVLPETKSELFGNWNLPQYHCGYRALRPQPMA